jgi:hypothetical protein
MPNVIDWDEYGVFKIKLSETFWPFGYDTVTIYRNNKPVLFDMCPDILERCKFPTAICKAAKLTVQDGKDRYIEEGGKIVAKTPLYVPPEKPKLIIPTKPKLVIPGDT